MSRPRRQAVMFPNPPSSPRVWRMHVRDAGCNGPGPGLNAEFECRRCGAMSEWQPVANYTEAKRGIPCPTCNAAAVVP